jgi:hypothetical protein
MATHRSKRASREHDEQIASPELLRLAALVIGIAMLMGLTAGIVWTLYHLVWLRWFG